MLEFYIQESGQYTKKDIIIPATLNTTFDETLDSAEVILKASNNETPYTPDTKCYFTDGTNRIANMIIVSDKVERLTHGIEKYRHTLQLTQNTRLLQKNLVRNSSFSQPRDKYKRGVSICNKGVNNAYDSITENTISFNYKEKFVCDDEGNGNIKVLVSMNKISNSGTTSIVSSLVGCQYLNDVNDWQTFVSSSVVSIYIDVSYTTGNNTQNHIDYTASTFPLNKSVNIPVDIDTTRTISEIEVWIKTPATNSTYAKNIIGVDTTTNKFSNLNIYYYAEIYTWSMYDILLTLRNQYFLEDSIYYYTEQEKADILYGLPSSSDTFGKILRNTIAPNFTFTGATFYECLSEIFKYYDAIFTLDQNNILGIEYLNEYNRAKIEATFSNRMSTFSEENFTTGYVSYFENALVEETFTSGARNKTLGKAEQTDWAFIVPHSIQSTRKVEIFVPQVKVKHAGQTQFYYTNWWFDFTDYIISQEVYATLSEEQQKDYLYYDDKSINIGGNVRYFIITYEKFNEFLKRVLEKTLLGNSTWWDIESVSADFRDTRFKITYMTKLDGRTRIENEETKYKGETIVNQANGAVDLNKMGLNMLGLSYKLGQPTLGMTQSITNWNDRVIKGQIYEYNGERWLANVVKYQFYNDHITANIDFIKNYNALSQRIQVDRQKRLSQISTGLTIKSEDNYCEYVYISSQSIAGGEALILANTILRNETLVFDTNTNFNSQYQVNFACITPYANGVIYRYDRWENDNIQIRNVYIPMIKYASGNAICFEMSYDSPITAGVRTHFEDASSGYSENGLYTNNGWADELTITFAKHTSTDFDDNFPYIQDSQLQIMGIIYYLKYFKKPNEIFALNYELIHLVPPERKGIDFIGNALIKSNGAISDGNAGIKLFYSTDEVYSPFDLQGFGTDISTTMSVNSSSTRSMTLRFSFSTIGVHTKSWAICDNQNNILFASNSDLYNKNYKDLFYSLRHYRI